MEHQEYRVELNLRTPIIDGLNELTLEDKLRAHIEGLVGFKVDEISVTEIPDLRQRLANATTPGGSSNG